MYVWICKPCMALSRGNQDSALVLRFRTLSFQSTGRNWRQHLRYKLYGWTCFFSQMWFETSRFGCKDSLNFKYPCLKSPKGRQMMQNCVWTIRLLRLVKTSKGVSKSLFNPKGKFVAFNQRQARTKAMMLHEMFSLFLWRMGWSAGDCRLFTSNDRGLGTFSCHPIFFPFLFYVG